MALKASPKKYFHRWNDDPMVVLDAAAAAASVFTEMGVGTACSVTLQWNDHTGSEDSIEAARQTLRISQTPRSVRVYAGPASREDTDEGTINEPAFFIDGTPTGSLYLAANGQNFDLIEKAFAAALDHAQRAAWPDDHEQEQEPSPNPSPASSHPLSAPPPVEKSDSHGPMIGWIENHPAVTGAVVGAVSVAAAVAIAIATN